MVGTTPVVQDQVVSVVHQSIANMMVYNATPVVVQPVMMTVPTISPAPPQREPDVPFWKRPKFLIGAFVAFAMFIGIVSAIAGG